jgi:polar amino acid transport system ATP-binding protein
VIEVTNVVKKYGPATVLNGATFQIADAQLTTILGPSGCGKSTMLRCLNRLERFDAGRIAIDDVEMHGAGAPSAAEDDEIVQRVRARVGLVFQNFNLFPHLTALGNVIEAPITVKKMPRPKAEEVGRYYLDRVGLSGKEQHYPAQLSGGQQQRVAIARALAMEPAVLLCDEITSALDPELVGEVLRVVESLAEEGMTLLMVTHEMSFARKVSDRVVFMHAGRIHEMGPPDQLFGAPKTPELQQFLSALT